MPLLATPEQLQRMNELVFNFLRLPMGQTTVPGALMEANLKEAHGGDCKVLHTYDFVDVISRSEKIGWQVKSTKVKTPVTWIRGKIPRKEELIKPQILHLLGCRNLETLLSPTVMNTLLTALNCMISKKSVIHG